MLIQKPWDPYIWLGDEDRGLAVFCESEAAWQEVDGKPGFLLERNGDAVEIVWRFTNAGTPWHLKKPWKLTFGIEATPVKDATVWRRFRPHGLEVTPLGYHNVWNVGDKGPQPSVTDGKYFGYPEAAASVDRYRRYVASFEKNGPHDSGPCLVLQYVLPMSLSANAPEAFYAAEWRSSPAPGGQWADEGSIYGTMLRIAPTASWRDFFLWKINQFINETGVDGIYADFTLLMEGTNVLTGFPYDVRDGKVRTFWPFFATRELYKRIYTLHKQIAKKRGKETFFFGHIANDICLPHAAFMDGALDGEHLNACLDKDYPELLPLDLIQAQYAGKNLGVCTYFLPIKVPFEKRKNWDTASKPYMMAMALLHDYGVCWGNFCMKPIDALMFAFDVTDAEFVPYWRNADLVGGQNDAIKASVYRKPDGGALVVVANVTRELQIADLSPDWERLKGPGDLSVSHALDKEPLLTLTQDGRLRLSLPPFGYRLIRIE